MKIAIASDHAGFAYKERIKEFLSRQGHECLDFGGYSEEPVDYPGIVRPVARAVAEGNVDRGIVLGGSGNGEAMVANRIPRVRCAVCWSRETAVLARSHHDANMLSLGARTISLEQALGIVEAWLTTPFEGGRHLRRIALMDEEESVSGTPQGKEGPFREPGAAGSALKEGNDASAQAPVPYDILISFRYIKYLEGKNAIEFQVDPGLKTPSIVHIPSEERWRAELQSWARDRREEILDRVKIKCSHMNCEWREY